MVVGEVAGGFDIAGNFFRRVMRILGDSPAIIFPVTILGNDVNPRSTLAGFSTALNKQTIPVI